MKRILLLPLLLAALFLMGCPSLPEGSPEHARVIRVIDGDTLVIQGGKEVRYIGIDTPEAYPDEAPFGAAARDINAALVDGKTVTLVRDKSNMDRYARLLRYVYVDDVFVNAALVSQGYAWATAYPPDTRYRDLFSQLEKEARGAGRGMWAPKPAGSR